MIKPGEIQRIANLQKVRDTQIEKDYILSWILWGISKHTDLSRCLVFKGGTALKKVYFEDYRFSEDLDFTLIKNQSNEQLKTWFNKIFEFILDETNIPLEIIDQNDYKDGGMNFYIQYTGPLGGFGNHKRVKVDISSSEELVFDPVNLDVFLAYSDQEKYSLQCYSLEEVLVEKLRSTIQRMQPRDFYDIWYLLEIHDMNIDFYIPEYKLKCKSKDIKPAVFHSNLEKRINQYKGRWEKSMNNQIQDLPDFDTVLRELSRHFKKFEI